MNYNNLDKKIEELKNNQSRTWCYPDVCIVGMGRILKEKRYGGPEYKTVRELIESELIYRHLEGVA